MRADHLFTAVWIALCALSLEAGLQVHYRVVVGEWLFRRTALPLYEADPLTGFRVRPNLALAHRTPEFRTTIFTDANGFRSEAGREPARTEPDALRLLLLGPSFAFGWGVDYEDSFGAMLERRLEQRLGRPVQTINAGVPAMGPRKQLRWFRANASKWRPDLVVQIVYGSLEVPADYGDDFGVSGSGYLLPRNVTPRQRVIGVLKKSALVFRTWSLAIACRPHDRDAVRGAGRRMAPAANFDPRSEAVLESMRFYGELHEAARVAGAGLLVAYSPLSYRVHPEDLPRWEHLGAPEPESSRRFDQDFAVLLREQGVPVLDLEPALRRAAEEDGRRLYYRVDIHWTPEGNRVAAHAAAESTLVRLTTYDARDCSRTEMNESTSAKCGTTALAP